MLLIDPYTIVFSCPIVVIAAITSDTLSMGNEDSGQKEAVVMWKQDPFIHSGLQQKQWPNERKEVTQLLLRELTECSSNTQDQEKKRSQKDMKQNPHDTLCGHHSQTFGLRTPLHS